MTKPKHKSFQVFYLHIVLMTLFTCCVFSGQATQFDTPLSAIDSTIVDTAQILPKDTIYFNSVYVSETSTGQFNIVVDSLLRVLDTQKYDLGSVLERMQSERKDQDIPLSLAKEYRPTWVLTVFVLILVFLGVVRLFFPHTFMNIILGFYNERILAQINKEDNVLTSWPYIFLYVIFSLSLGLFVTLYIAVYNEMGLLTINNFLKLSAIIGFLFVAKLLLIRIISVIFETEKIVRNYITVLYLIYFNGTLYLLPFLLLAVFLPFMYIHYLMVIFVIGIVIMFIYRIARTLFGLLGHLKFSIFYLILYLCALEIAPILILVKSLNR